MFEQVFRDAQRRLRSRILLRAASRRLPWLEFTGLALLLAVRAEFLTLRFGLSLAGAAIFLYAASLLATALRAPRGRDAALILDRRLGTRELLTAAHETSPDASHPLDRSTREQATEALQADDVRRGVPLWERRAWRPALLGSAALLLALLVPLPGRQSGPAVASAEVDPIVEETEEHLQEELGPLADQLAEIDRPEAQDAFAELQEMMDAMEESDTAEEALVALAEAEQALEKREPAAAEERLDSLVDDLAAEPLGAEMSRAMKADDREALREALRNLSQSLDMNEAQAQASADQLQRFADRLANLASELERRGEGELADQLRELAQALRDGDLEKARELAQGEEMAGACQAVGEMTEAERLRDEAQRMLQSARFLLGQQPPSLGESNQPGQGAGGPSPQAGSASTDEEAAAFEAAQVPQIFDRQSTRSEHRQEQFGGTHESRVLTPEQFEDMRASGRLGENGDMLAEPGLGLGVDGGGAAPLRALPGGVVGAAERGVDLEEVPLGYRELVRGYFERGQRKSPSEGSDGEQND